ncbi:MAG: TIGR00730 family Rossman fold protein [Anaerolineales bacterium]
MRRIVVYCGSSGDVASVYLDAAREMGRTIAGLELALVYGGGATGLMGAVADAALESGGEVIGVTIDQFTSTELGHKNLTELYVMDDIQARKARMLDLSDGIVALPGGLGTFDELVEGLSWAQLGFHEKPVGLLNTNNYFDPFMSLLDHARSEGFLYVGHADLLISDNEPGRLLERLGSFRPHVNLAERWAKQAGGAEEKR